MRLCRHDADAQSLDPLVNPYVFGLGVYRSFLRLPCTPPLKALRRCMRLRVSAQFRSAPKKMRKMMVLTAVPLHLLLQRATAGDGLDLGAAALFEVCSPIQVLSVMPPASSRCGSLKTLLPVPGAD